MRTKTLLITAAIGAAAVVASQAQVYSVNAVGYINLAIPSGWSIQANQLIQGEGNNTVAALFGSVLDNNTQVIKYSAGGGYDSNIFFKEGEEYEWNDPEMTLSPGEAFWVNNPGDPKTITLVGEVPQGSLSNPLAMGYNLVSSIVPQEGLVSTDLGLPLGNEDLVQMYPDNDTGGGGFGTYIYFEEGGESEWDPKEPTIPVGVGMWVFRNTAGSWDRDFSVND